MHPLHIVYINGPDIERLALTETEILAAVEGGLRTGTAAADPGGAYVDFGSATSTGRLQLHGGVVDALSLLGVRAAGDFIDNEDLGLRANLSLLTLFDPVTGVPLAVLNATPITDMRAGAMTALGAKYLARKDSRVLGHLGAGGSAYWNVRLLNHLFDFEEIRVHSKHARSRSTFAARLTQELGKPVTVAESWETCVRDADIVVEAARLSAPQPLLDTRWIKRGATVIPYGTMSAMPLSLIDIMDKVVVDDWRDCVASRHGGALRQHVDEGRLTQEGLHAQLGQVIEKSRPGRAHDAENILYWHAGSGLCDIALAGTLLDKAGALGIGQTLRFA